MNLNALAAKKEIIVLGTKAERMELKLVEELITRICCKLDEVKPHVNEYYAHIENN